MKRLALLVLAVAPFCIPSVAHAAVPCRDRIYNDWYANGKIATTYPVACYKDALAHIPADAKVYSNLSQDIHSALQAALARKAGKSEPAEVGRGVPAADKGGGADKTVNLKSTTPTATSTPTPGTTTVAAAETSGSSGLPLPIIILGALAILLAAAGAAGAGLRHFKNRQP